MCFFGKAQNKSPKKQSVASLSVSFKQITFLLYFNKAEEKNENVVKWASSIHTFVKLGFKIVHLFQSQ